MANLTTRFLGISFPNPFVLASAPITATGTHIIEGFKAGWGGAVLKTIGLEPTPTPSPRIYTLKSGRSSGRSRVGMINLELITDLTLPEWQSELHRIREAFPDRPVIASIMGGGRKADWQQVIDALEPCGVAGFEMNVSCPNYAEERGAQLGQDPQSLRQAVRWVRESTRLPVIVKLTPNVTDIVALARVAMEAGADAVTATNTLSGLAGVDLDTLDPLPTVECLSAFGGYSGPGLKPVALRCAAAIARAIHPPLIGCGGIGRWQDAAEFLAVGASLVEVCTAVMWDGYGIIHGLTKGLEGYLAGRGMDSPAALTGKALPHLVQFSTLNLEARLAARVNPALCSGCGNCVTACEAGGADAIEMEAKKAQVVVERCIGCGLCVGVCPTDGIAMSPVAPLSAG
jgi:dihydropyrimidine dehydrogenase (NAD+) subunit PreA